VQQNVVHAEGKRSVLITIIKNGDASTLDVVNRVKAALPAIQKAAPEDKQIRAVLLLHGLHPEEVEVRVRRSIEKLRPQLAERGLGLELLEVGVARARLRLRLSGGQAMPVDATLLGQEIEAAIVDAAPELEVIAIDGLDAAEAREIAVAAD